jgi:VWFA-related protein
MRHFAGYFTALFFASATLTAQTSQSPLPPRAQQPQLQSRIGASPEAMATIRARAKLVVIDVVVTGKDRAPFKGLKQQDFTLTENGVPQTFKAFEEHTGLTPTEALKFPPLSTLPPGIFTNYTPTPINSAVNILLLDALNTPFKDQTFVRDQLLDYVKKAKPGTSVAIFGLTTQLHLLQGFTSDPETLRKAVKLTQGKFSPLLDDAVGGGTTESLTDQMAHFGPSLSDAAAGLSNLESMQQSFQLQMRAKYTLDAMSILARYLANIPGRKNLIWFSGSFPVDILPDGDAADPFLAVASSEAEYRETTNLLARSQVAVYPIDARGLMTLPMFSAANTGSKYVRNPTAMGKDINKFFAQTADEHGTMRRMAEDTGGEAFVNTNGLSQAVSKAIDEGSNYYTLAYTPTNTEWKGDFRKISVKLSQSGYKLAYRHGYYADDPNSPNSALASTTSPSAAARAEGRPDPAMQQAMIHGLPGGTQIIYKLRVLPASTTPEDAIAPHNLTGASGFAPAKGPFQRLLVDYAADPHDLTFALAKDGKYHASLEFVSLLYDKDGRVVVASSNIIDSSVTPTGYAALLHGGFPFHQEISVPTKGDYTLRTGIHDITSSRIGAVELPISAIRKLPPPTPTATAK